jgi:hypothetical protein
MSFLLRLLPLLKSGLTPLKAWWIRLNWNDKITIVIIVAVGCIVGFQYLSLRQHNREIVELKAKVAELATKADLARIDGRIDATHGQIESVNTSIGKLETDLDKVRGGIKPPTITGMSESAIVDAFKKLGAP